MVGCSRCTFPSIHLSFRLRWHSEDHGRLPDEDMSKHVRRNHLVWTPFEAIALPLPPSQKTFFFFSLGRLGKTHMTMDTWDMFFYKTQRGPAPLRTSAAHRASSCTTAPASCRRPGTRTGCRSGRHPTPGAPACRDERPKSCVAD